jgi:hypothetical protein
MTDSMSCKPLHLLTLLPLSLLGYTINADTDEYLVPMGDYTSMKDVLRDAEAGGTKIFTFRSSRGRLRLDHSYDDGDSRVMSPNKTYLEAFNCDNAGLPKPPWADRARKQVYKSDYVLNRFVHFSIATQGYLQHTYNQTPRDEWSNRFGEHPPVERNSIELKEAVMVHTKFVSATDTRWYKNTCRQDNRQNAKCMVAYPWPNGKAKKGDPTANLEGMAYNCYINPHVDSYWVPRLQQALSQRRHQHQ